MQVRVMGPRGTRQGLTAWSRVRGQQPKPRDSSIWPGRVEAAGEETRVCPWVWETEENTNGLSAWRAVPHQDEFGSYRVVTLLSAAWHPPIAVTPRRLPVESSAFRLGRDSLSPFLGITHSLENSRKLPCQGLISWPYDF